MFVKRLSLAVVLALALTYLAGTATADAAAAHRRLGPTRTLTEFAAAAKKHHWSTARHYGTAEAISDVKGYNDDPSFNYAHWGKSHCYGADDPDNPTQQSCTNGSYDATLTLNTAKQRWYVTNVLIED